MSAPADPLRLWLVSRSQYEDGFWCPRSRYLQYHAGQYGYGLRLKAESLPLATGTHVHEPIGAVLTWIMAQPNQQAIDWTECEHVTRAAVAAAKRKYFAVVDARGLRNLDLGETAEQVMREQLVTIEALTWAFVIEELPRLLEQRRIVSVEQEEESVLDCTCGLGDEIGSFADHHARGCDGIGLQGRADFLTEDLHTQELDYRELKTVGATGERWETQWADKLQFVMGIIGASRRMERPIPAHGVYGLIKGRRIHADRMPDGTYGGPIIQDSRLVYPFRKEAVPPVESEDWQPEYYFTDDFDGKRHSLGKKYRKAFIGDASGDSPLMQAAEQNGMSIGEYWTRIVPPALRQKYLTYIGPLRISPVMQAKLTRQFIANERDWQARVWEAYQAFDAVGGVFAAPQFQATLDALFPCSWECNRFGKKYACQFHQLCHEETGWEDPLGNGRYVPRRPHHTPELEQAEARGLAPPEEGVAEEGGPDD